MRTRGLVIGQTTRQWSTVGGTQCSAVHRRRASIFQNHSRSAEPGVKEWPMQTNAMFSTAVSVDTSNTPLILLWISQDRARNKRPNHSLSREVDSSHRCNPSCRVTRNLLHPVCSLDDLNQWYHLNPVHFKAISFFLLDSAQPANATKFDFCESVQTPVHTKNNLGGFLPNILVQVKESSANDLTTAVKQSVSLSSSVCCHFQTILMRRTILSATREMFFSLGFHFQLLSLALWPLGIFSLVPHLCPGWRLQRVNMPLAWRPRMEVGWL